MALHPTLIRGLHLAFVAPLLVYTGYTLQQGRVNVPNGIPQLLAATGVGVAAYHGYRAYTRMQQGQTLAKDYGLQVNAFHVLLVAPIVAYTGYQLMQKQRPNPWQATALLILGGGAFLHHALRLFM